MEREVRHSIDQGMRGWFGNSAKRGAMTGETLNEHETLLTLQVEHTKHLIRVHRLIRGGKCLRVSDVVAALPCSFRNHKKSEAGRFKAFHGWQKSTVMDARYVYKKCLIE
jgi:hypothetical protein